MATKIPARKVRGIRDSIPAGYVLGRMSSGEGDVQLIHLSELGKHLVGLSGGGSGSGTGAGGGVASSSSVQQVSQALGGATTILQTLVTTVNNITLNGAGPLFIQRKCGDETTAITAANGKDTFRMPCDLTLAEVRASLTTPQVTGSTFTVDLKQGGVSVFSTLVTIDNTTKTSKSAASQSVVSTASLADDAEMRIDVTQVGDGTATGLKLTLIGEVNAFIPSLDFSNARNSQYIGVA